MTTIDLAFDIEETITYTGHVTVDQDHLAAWMAAEGEPVLTAAVLSEYAATHDSVHVEEKHENVRGQAWTDLQLDEGEEPAGLTLPLEARKA